MQRTFYTILACAALVASAHGVQSGKIAAKTDEDSLCKGINYDSFHNRYYAAVSESLYDNGDACKECMAIRPKGDDDKEHAFVAMVMGQCTDCDDGDIHLGQSLVDEFGDDAEVEYVFGSCHDFVAGSADSDDLLEPEDEEDPSVSAQKATLEDATAKVFAANADDADIAKIKMAPSSDSDKDKGGVGWIAVTASVGGAVAVVLMVVLIIKKTGSKSKASKKSKHDPSLQRSFDTFASPVNVRQDIAEI